jgi:hypothetical protein
MKLELKACLNMALRGSGNTDEHESTLPLVWADIVVVEGDVDKDDEDEDDDIDDETDARGRFELSSILKPCSLFSMGQ